MNRREFLKMGSLAAVAAAGGCRTVGSTGARQDENLTVFISDVHVRPDSYQIGRLETVVGKILAMDPMPKRVVSLGDLAWLYGRRTDYETSRPILERLLSAGIELTFGMGNHDRRENFLAVWPEYRSRLLTSDRVVSETSLGTCDLIVLDTLWQNHADESKMTEVDGELLDAQLAWLREAIVKHTRPFFLAAHHPINEIRNGHWKVVNDLVMGTPTCLGWLHGHDHKWKHGLLAPTKRNWGDNVFKRWLCMPSTGHWGDIGFVAMRTGDGFARAELTMLDRYFPNPDKRTWIDAEIVKEQQGARCTFCWQPL